MRFLADESCDFALVRALRDAGHDVVAVHEKMPGADAVVIEEAVRDRRVLLTEDADFGQLVFASAARSPGVVFVRFPATLRRAMVSTLLEFVTLHGQRIAGSFVLIQPGRVRVTKKMAG